MRYSIHIFSLVLALAAAMLLIVACAGASMPNSTDSSTNTYSNKVSSKAPETTASGWVGSYITNVSLGTIADDMPISVGIEIKFFEDNGQLMAEYNADGYQTMSRQIFIVKQISPTKAELVFERHGEEDAFKRDDFKKGDVLLTLSKTSDKEIEAAYSPVFEVEGIKTLKFEKTGG